MGMRCEVQRFIWCCSCGSVQSETQDALGARGRRYQRGRRQRSRTRFQPGRTTHVTAGARHRALRRLVGAGGRVLGEPRRSVEVAGVRYRAEGHQLAVGDNPTHQHSRGEVASSGAARSRVARSLARAQTPDRSAGTHLRHACRRVLRCAPNDGRARPTHGPCSSTPTCKPSAAL